MMDRSYDLPSQAKQGLLRRLFIFIADWTLELDEAVCAWEPEQAAAQPRYSLSNTIRQYAQEKLV